MTEIRNREDVFKLVTTFYGKVRSDDLLGPIFNRVIDNWEHHFEHLTDFWESQLFMVNKFNGNPLKKHVEVDIQAEHTISEMHFGVWLNLWFQTINELYSGEKAQLAKNRARNMGTYIHLQIFKARQGN